MAKDEWIKYDGSVPDTRGEIIRGKVLAHFRAIAEKHHDVTANQIELLKYQISMSPRYKTVIKVGGHCMKIHLNGSGDLVHIEDCKEDERHKQATTPQADKKEESTSPQNLPLPEKQEDSTTKDSTVAHKKKLFVDVDPVGGSSESSSYRISVRLPSSKPKKLAAIAAAALIYDK